MGKNALSGSCLCGAVRVSAEPKGNVGACHCEQCRRWAAGPFLTVHGGADVDFDGAENIQTYRSSEWAERGFCRLCGSSLYYRLLPGDFSAEGEYILSVGLFDDQSAFSFDHEVYVDKNPGWYRFAGEEGRKRMTEADILAMVGAKS